MGEVLYSSNTAGSATGLAATDTSLLAGNVKPSHYSKVRINSMVKVDCSASATARTITLKIKQGSTTLASRTLITTAGATTGAFRYNESLDYIGPLNAGGSISIQAIGSGADATHTLLTAENLYVEGIE